MKKITLLPALALAAGLTLTGCSSDDDGKLSKSEPSSSPSASPSNEPTEAPSEAPTEEPSESPAEEPQDTPKAGYHDGNGFTFKIPEGWKAQEDAGAISAFYINEKTGDSINVIEVPGDYAQVMENKQAFEKQVFSELTSTGFEDVSKLEDTTLGGEKAFTWSATQVGTDALVYQLAAASDETLYVVTIGGADKAKAKASYDSISSSWEWK